VALGDPSLARRNFAGSFDRESLDDVLTIIGRGTRTRLSRHGDTAVLLPIPQQ